MDPEFLARQAERMRARKAAKAAAAAAAAASAPPPVDVSDSSDSSDASEAGTLPPPEGEADVQDVPGQAVVCSGDDSVCSDTDTVEPSPGYCGGEVPGDLGSLDDGRFKGRGGDERDEGGGDGGFWEEWDRRGAVGARKVARRKRALESSDSDEEGTPPRKRRGSAGSSRGGGKGAACRDGMGKRAGKRSPVSRDALSGFQGCSEDDEEDEARRGSATPLAVTPEYAEMDDGIDHRETRMVEELQEERKLWGAELYPRIDPMDTVYCDLLAEDLSLSSLPGDSQASLPVGVLPARVVRFLSGYQRDGVKFLFRLYERGRGGLLADAMGLGKTIEMVAFLGATCGVWDRPLGRKPDSARILICTPVSVTVEWKRTIEKWAPFRVMMYDSDEKRAVKRGVQNNEVDIVIVSETALRGDLRCDSHRERGGGRPFFNQIKWNILVIDELQVAKNRRTAIYRALDAVDANVKYGMTGTAMQNKLTDLHSVLYLLVRNSGLFPDLGTFKHFYAKPIEAGRDKNASAYAVQNAQTALKNLRRLLSKHMIRRSKQVIADCIPGKTDCGVTFKMMPNTLQWTMWSRFINSYDCYMVRVARQPCACGRDDVSKNCCHGYPTTPEQLEQAPVWKIRHVDGEPCRNCPNCLSFSLIFVGLSITCHALLLLPDLDDSKKVDPVVYKQRVFLVKYYSDGEVDEKSPIKAAEFRHGISCKLDAAKKLIDMFNAGGNKTIIFYQSLRLGKILQRWATAIGYRFKSIDGSTSKAERQANVDEFNREKLFTLFFVSKQAGGTGLNITAANRVLLFEPHWNPSLDLQSQDRAHRLGQKNVVKVFRLIVEGSIEEYQIKTQLNKNQLSNIVLDDTCEPAMFNKDEIGSMAAMLRIDGRFKPGAGLGSNIDCKKMKLNFVYDEAPNGLLKAVAAEEDDDITTSLFGGPRDCLMGMDKEYLDVTVGDAERAELGLANANLPALASHVEFESSDDEVHLAAEKEAGKGGRFEASHVNNDARNDVLPIISDTQLEDIALMECNAGGKAMFTSNEAKNMGRKQLLNLPDKNSGGVNCGRDEVNKVDLDENPMVTEEGTASGDGVDRDGLPTLTGGGDNFPVAKKMVTTKRTKLESGKERCAVTKQYGTAASRSNRAEAIYGDRRAASDRVKAEPTARRSKVHPAIFTDKSDDEADVPNTRTEKVERWRVLKKAEQDKARQEAPVPAKQTNTTKLNKSAGAKGKKAAAKGGVFASRKRGF